MTVLSLHPGMPTGKLADWLEANDYQSICVLVDAMKLFGYSQQQANGAVAEYIHRAWQQTGPAPLV